VREKGERFQVHPGKGPERHKDYTVRGGSKGSQKPAEAGPRKRIERGRTGSSGGIMKEVKSFPGVAATSRLKLWHREV